MVVRYTQCVVVYGSKVLCGSEVVREVVDGSTS